MSVPASLVNMEPCALIASMVTTVTVQRAGVEPDVTSRLIFVNPHPISV